MSRHCRRQIFRHFSWQGSELRYARETQVVRFRAPVTLKRNREASSESKTVNYPSQDRKRLRTKVRGPFVGGEISLLHRKGANQIESPGFREGLGFVPVPNSHQKTTCRGSTVAVSGRLEESHFRLLDFEYSPTRAEAKLYIHSRAGGNKNHQVQFSKTERGGVGRGERVTPETRNRDSTGFTERDRVLRYLLHGTQDGRRFPPYLKKKKKKEKSWIWICKFLISKGNASRTFGKP